MIDKMIVEGNWWWKKTKKEKQILYSTHFNYYKIKNQNEYDLMHDQRQYLKQNCINLSKINNQNSIFNAKKKNLHQQYCNLFTPGLGFTKNQMIRQFHRTILSVRNLKTIFKTSCIH